MSLILGFSGSFSNESINHELVIYASSLCTKVDTKVIRLSDFEAPIYSKDLEKQKGIPESIKNLRELFDQADGFMISTPEYNSSLPGGFKNTLDWLSRMEGKIFQDKPVLLMAASPGGRGGQSVLNHLSGVMPFWGAKLIGPFSLPKFGEHFQNGNIIEPELDGKLRSLVGELESTLS